MPRLKDHDAIRRIAKKTLFEGLDALCEGAIIVHRAARGLSAKKADVGSSFAVLFDCVPLLVLGFTLTLFHLGNAAMLPP